MSEVKNEPVVKPKGAVNPQDGSIAEVKILPKSEEQDIPDSQLKEVLSILFNTVNSGSADIDYARHRELSVCINKVIINVTEYSIAKTNITYLISELRLRTDNRILKLMIQGHGLSKWSSCREKDDYRKYMSLISTIAWTPNAIKDFKDIQTYGANLKRYVEENISI